MIKTIIEKTNLNVSSMLKHGTVAVLTMFGVGALFGVKNVMLAFPIALTSAVLGRQNLQVKTFSKLFRIMLVDIVIVTLAYISSTNLILGIIVNFITIFLIMYTIVSPYDLTFYKPFVMLYVFSQYAAVTIYELPLRILSIIFGIIMVAIGNLINKSNEKNNLSNSIRMALEILSKQIENILNYNYNEKLSEDFTKVMRDLAYRIYISRHKRYLTTNLGTIQFEIYIYMEHFNIILEEINEKFKNNIIKKEEIFIIGEAVSSLLKYSKDEINIEELKSSILVLSDEISIMNEEEKEIKGILLGLYESLKNLSEIKRKEINKLYKEWERSDIDQFKTTFKEYFNIETIRFKFAIRMAITLTLALYVGEKLGFYKIIWAIITIMSIMQPYYEDTIKKARDRVKGNVLAILFTGVVINIINVRYVTILILVLALYLLYGFKEYYKISLFAAIASICVASLTQSVNVLIFYRVIYVIAGVIIVYLANRFIFPYKIEKGVYHLIAKISRLNNRLIDDSKLFMERKINDSEIRDIIIHSTLLCQKLYLRNLQYKSEEVSEFISTNNKFVIEVGYRLLSKEIDDYKIDKILDLYKIFNKVYS